MNRTGVGSYRGSVRNAMTDVLRSYQLNNRWFAVDNGGYGYGYCQRQRDRRWLAYGSHLDEYGGTLLRRGEHGRPLALGEFPALLAERRGDDPSCARGDCCPGSVHEPGVAPSGGHVKRDWGDTYVALLWNPGSAEGTVTLDFETAGMNPKHRYAVWSFWDNRYMGIAKGSWKTLALAPSASQHLCFTDLDRTPDKPVLIGSSLHIYCGAAEIKCVKQGRGSMEIELTDAGAREGDLFYL